MGKEAGEVGPSASTAGDGVHRFPSAAQPEIMRAAEKDDNYASFVSDACRDAFRHLFGARLALAYHTQTKLIGQMLYYVLTTGAGHQTLGEEYCDLLQIAGSYGLPPTPARRTLFVLYHTALPYLAERMSSRIASRGMLIADSNFDDFRENNAPTRTQLSDEIPSSSMSDVPISSLSRWKDKFRRCHLYILERWPTGLPIAREVLQLFLRTNLMLFYFEGLYYHISKRASGIRYMFIGKPTNQRPRYQILGVFLLIQLCVIGAERLRRSNLSSLASSAQEISVGSYPLSADRREDVLTTNAVMRVRKEVRMEEKCVFVKYTKVFTFCHVERGLPVLNEDGSLISTADSENGSFLVESSSSSEEVHYGMVQRKAGMPSMSNTTDTFKFGLFVSLRLLEPVHYELQAAYVRMSDKMLISLSVVLVLK
ncbi:hypothetical protein KSS87_019069 [Heliosperma pusillum]|nr:hypothetical protein KSS87_019069 [Heliosperma pusillum]